MTKRILLMICCGLVAATFGPVRAGDDEPAVKLPARDAFREVTYEWNADEVVPGQHIKLTVSPAELPHPLLKYRLNTYVTESESGNAAPLYSEAYSLLYQRRENTLRWKVYETEEYAKAMWPKEFGLDTPPRDQDAVGKLKFKAFPVPAMWSTECWTEIDAGDEATLYNDTLRQVFHLIEKASKKRDCDWGYLIERKGIATMLEHIQQTRELARFLQGKANWEIRNGKFDDAVKTLRLGLRLSEHVKTSDFPCLVTELVGIAIQGIMESEIRLLSAQPDAPNLYPALTQVNAEPGDLFQRSLQAEQYWLFYSGKNVQDIFERVDSATDEECKMLLEEIISVLMQVQSDNYEETKTATNNMMSLACIACYPYGKARLLKQGLTDEEIGRMSVYRIVTPYVLEEIKSAYDLLIVASTFPVDSKHTAIVFDENELLNVSDSPAKIYLALVLPAVQAAKHAFLRQQQSFDLLKITEAIRYYAAVHDGKLPESLEAIEELYVPKINPMDNKPYGYCVEGNTAYVEYYMFGRDLSRMDVTVE